MHERPAGSPGDLVHPSEDLLADAAASGCDGHARVALVNMPWSRTNVPSIQCGLLKSELLRAGHHVSVFYMNMRLAAHIGAVSYQAITALPAERYNFLGEWLFGSVAFGSRSDDAEYLSRAGVKRALKMLDMDPEYALHMREDILPKWIRDLADNTPWSDYDVVGFTSTFQQNVASLALARLIKGRFPSVVIVFGGANFEGGMGEEYTRALPWIDFAVLGEGDIAFPELVSRLAQNKDVLGISGISYRANGKVVQTGRPATPKHMDDIPSPDYFDYFTTLADLGGGTVLGGADIRLLYESSRGCWWGEKHHCTFCGLNGLGMAFRSKSPTQVVNAVRELAESYRILRIDMVDNILDMSYLNSLCSQLGAEEWDLKLFYEVKANLTPDQLEGLRSAGVVEIQPGIESLSTHVLQLMRKGSTQLINLRLLKWAQYYGIEAGWNILIGFPGETDEDYRSQAELIPALHHLRPPESCGPISLQRFSPYFDDQSFPIRDVRPMSGYKYVYPPELNLQEVAYYFEYRADEQASRAAHSSLITAVKLWRDEWTDGNPPILNYRRGPGWLRFVDTREGRHREATISGWRASVYEFCGDRARRLDRAQEFVRGICAGDSRGSRVLEFLDNCVAERLMAVDDGQYFSLALPSGRAPLTVRSR